MSTNLVSTVTQVLSSNFVSRVASSLGLDGAQVEKALQAGAPALLAALTSLVSKPAGAAALDGTVAQQQPGVLTSLANMIGGSGQKALIDTGGSTLTSLLGGSTTSALTNAVGQYAGIGEGGSKEPYGHARTGRDGRARTTTARERSRCYGPRKPSCFTKRQHRPRSACRFRQLSQRNWDPRSHHRPNGAARTRLRRIAIDQHDHAVLALTGAWDFSNRRHCLVSVLRPEPDADCCRASVAQAGPASVDQGRDPRADAWQGDLHR